MLHSAEISSQSLISNVTEDKSRSLTDSILFRSSIEGSEMNRSVSNWYNHPDYKTGDEAVILHQGDIAVLKLDRPVPFTKYSTPACLPPNSVPLDESTMSSRQCYATGKMKYHTINDQSTLIFPALYFADFFLHP